MPTIIIEDGTIVDNANSYITLAEVKTYALDRNITLSGGDSIIEGQLIIANDYLESKGSEYQGIKTNAETDGTEKIQPLQWPRTGVVLDCTVSLGVNEIPKYLKDAQAQLVIEQDNGVDLSPTRTGKFVIEEQVGPLKTKYSSGVATTGQPYMPSVENLLEPLYDSCQSSNFSTKRV